eukprot:CAMPEP_0174856120 /NCGR_PEP_ID=MMETSP1114-20130205/35118_1 /TAXON_ID=312471 /ORGANISM="Neobodo designis, Strain CCAP 1951/1" /LENGTH=41 /DNA_ID= /DNA_START= /DNA_END= /DNA_ORIENTATION=
MAPTLLPGTGGRGNLQPQEVVHLARSNFHVVRRLIVGAAFR